MLLPCICAPGGPGPALIPPRLTDSSCVLQGLPPPSQAADSKSVHEQQAPQVLLLSHQPGARAAQCQREEAGGYPYGMLRPLGQVTCFKVSVWSWLAGKLFILQLMIPPPPSKQRRQDWEQDSCDLM